LLDRAHTRSQLLFGQQRCPSLLVSGPAVSICRGESLLDPSAYGLCELGAATPRRRGRGGRIGWGRGERAGRPQRFRPPVCAQLDDVIKERDRCFCRPLIGRIHTVTIETRIVHGQNHHWCPDGGQTIKKRYIRATEILTDCGKPQQNLLCRRSSSCFQKV